MTRDTFKPKGRPRSINGPIQYKNITVNPEVQTLVNEYRDSLESELGFKPNISQAIKIAIKRAKEKTP